MKNLSLKRITWLSFLFLSFCVGPWLRAQDRPASPQSEPDSQGSSQPRRESKPRRDGFGNQLARESREAAGEEEDQTAEFKRSASVRAVSRITGLSLQYSYWLCVLLNFAIIAVVLLWAARKNLPSMFRDRSSAIQRAMQEAQKASEEARRRLAEIESRLMRLDGEIGMMRDAAEKDATVEEARIQTAAEEDARKIVESAGQEIAAAAKNARRELTAYAADLAVGLAQKQIRVDAATDQALVREFTGQLNAVAGSPEDLSRKGGS